MKRNRQPRPGLYLTLLALLCAYARPGVADDVVVRENIAYRSGDALSDYERERCLLDLYLPDGASGFPVVVWFHGGGLTAGNKDEKTQVDIARTLAARGIGVAAVGYRLSPQATYPAYIDDAAASVAWVLDHIADYRGDPQSVFVSGHSAGGYLVAMVGLDDQYLSAYGHRPGDLAGLMPISGQMVTHQTVRTERGLPADRPIVDAAAPVYHVRADAPPILAVAGSEDLPARAAENIYFVAAMQAAGDQDVTFHEFEGRSHGTIVTKFAEPDDPVARAMVDFVLSHAHR
jgi:acetyl esterase/lipase